MPVGCTCVLMAATGTLAGLLCLPRWGFGSSTTACQALPGSVYAAFPTARAWSSQNKGLHSSWLIDILRLVQRATGDSFKVNLTIGVQLSHAAELIGIIEQVSSLAERVLEVLYSFELLYSPADQVAGVHSLAFLLPRSWDKVAAVHRLGGHGASLADALAEEQPLAPCVHQFRPFCCVLQLTIQTAFLRPQAARHCAVPDTSPALCSGALPMVSMRQHSCPSRWAAFQISHGSNGTEPHRMVERPNKLDSK